MEIWEPKTSGTLWATPGLLRDPFTLLSQLKTIIYLSKSNILVFIWGTVLCEVGTEIFTSTIQISLSLLSVVERED
jgi:hypothetical protein